MTATPASARPALVARSTLCRVCGAQLRGVWHVVVGVELAIPKITRMTVLARICTKCALRCADEKILAAARDARDLGTATK